MEESWGDDAAAVDEGKVRGPASRTSTSSSSSGARRVGHVDSLQPPFSLIRAARPRSLDPVVRRP